MWPGSRALIGGLFVAVGAGALAWQVTAARAEPTSEFVVAVADLAPGSIVSADDVGLLAIDLPSSVAALSFGDGTETEVLGTVVVNPVSAGEIVARNDVRDGAVDVNRIEVTFELDVPRALNGRLRRGEVVDVVATVGTGVAQVTSFVAQAASVVWLEAVGSDGLSTGTAAVTLALNTRAELGALVAAIDTGTVTLARVPEDLRAPLPTGTAPTGTSPTGTSPIEDSSSATNGNTNDPINEGTQP